MSSIGIAELTALGAAPASNDLLVIVDSSDTAQSLAGSTKNLTVANLFTAASFPTTVNVVGNFSVNTNKFTVAAASGNTVVAGTLGVTGATTLSAALGITANTAALSTTSATGTTAHYYLQSNTGAASFIGVESSTGGSLLTGTSAYETVINTQTAHGIRFGVNNTLAMSIAVGGAVTLASTLTLPLGGGTGLVSVGAVDSGGAGFRLLRVPN